MPDTEKNARKMPRALFALIPISFVAMVGVMVLLGENNGGPVEDPDIVLETDPFEASSSPVDVSEVTDPDGVGGTVTPTLSGPEGRDNSVFFEN
ncbi:MAG: hypothetical protein AAGK92_13050 [Pseudomonadota bacterium]